MKLWCVFSDWTGLTNESASRQIGSGFCYACPSFTSTRLGLYTVLRSTIHNPSPVFYQAMDLTVFRISTHCSVFDMYKKFCFHPQSTGLTFSLLEHRVSNFLWNVGINRVYILLTVHLSISLDNDQLDAHLLCFTIRPLQSSTCFEHYMLIIRRLTCIVASSGIVLSVSGRPVHRTATDWEWRYQMLHQYNSTSWRWACNARNM